MVWVLIYPLAFALLAYLLFWASNFVSADIAKKELNRNMDMMLSSEYIDHLKTKMSGNEWAIIQIKQWHEEVEDRKILSGLSEARDIWPKEWLVLEEKAWVEMKQLFAFLVTDPAMKDVYTVDQICMTIRAFRECLSNNPVLWDYEKILGALHRLKISTKHKTPAV